MEYNSTIFCESIELSYIKRDSYYSLRVHYSLPDVENIFTEESGFSKEIIEVDGEEKVCYISGSDMMIFEKYDIISANFKSTELTDGFIDKIQRCFEVHYNEKLCTEIKAFP